MTENPDLYLCFAVEVNSISHGGFDEDVVEREAGQRACKDFDLSGHIEAVVEDDALFAAYGAQPAAAPHEVFTGYRDTPAFGEGLKFLQKLGIGHVGKEGRR